MKFRNTNPQEFQCVKCGDIRFFHVTALALAMVANLERDLAAQG